MCQLKRLNQIEKYGLNWAPGFDPVEIEIEMVRHGGRWKKRSGDFAGKGMEFHFKRLMSILWPWVVWHPWAELQMKCYLNYRIIGQLGAASTGKSFIPAACVLADYYCHPNSTTVMVSSTTRESLEMRVWGEIKKLHKSAKTLFPWLPGYLIEGRQRIVSDPKNEASDGRDFRNGLVGVACFPSGSLVDTPIGPIPIETIRPGDRVVNALGTGVVSSIHSRVAKRLARVHISDGRQIDCTEEHPFLTQKGWIKAIDLETLDMVFSAHETMQIMQGSNRVRIPEQKVLLSNMPRFRTTTSVQTMRSLVPTSEQIEGVEGDKVDGEILQQGLFGKVGGRAQRMLQETDEALPSLRKTDGVGSFPASVLLEDMPRQAADNAVPSMRKGIHIHTGIPKEETHSFLQYILQEESERSSELSKACLPNSRGDGSLEDVPGVHCPLSYSHRQEVQGWQQALVSVGHSISGNQTGGGNRRRNSSNENQSRQGYSENGNTKPAWVDRIEILEPSGDERFDEGQEGYPVFNLEVTGHPSYSVNGVIVHNCKRGQSFQGIEEYIGIKNKHLRLLADELQFLPRVFVDGIANLNKNPDFKCVGSGNPKDTTDALGVLCEPAAHLGGWDGGIDQTPKTKTWEIRFPNGIAIQLPGSDSPNLDGRLGIPIITQEQIDADIRFYGKDSIQYSMMDEGRMPRGQGSRRVITRQLCLKHHAMEEPIWLNNTRTRIGCLDAAYRGVGGDRCVFMELQFGLNSERKTIIALIDSMVIPITDMLKDTPEDQIAIRVRDECERRGITPEHMAFDSTGRGSLMSAFGRLWSPHVVAVEFGGTPTDRPVSMGIDMTCREYYSKFVSELWFSSRLVIEADQFRGMTDDVMMEGCYREWTKVGANKTEVETKEKMKLKSGRSPDLYDCLCTGIELARRLGFKIESTTNIPSSARTDAWKRELRERAKALWSDHSLSYG